MTIHPNIRFAYLYRDASNYKQHGEVIFSNEKQFAVDEIEKRIRSFLSDGLFFIARQVHVSVTLPNSWQIWKRLIAPDGMR